MHNTYRKWTDLSSLDTFARNRVLRRNTFSYLWIINVRLRVHGVYAETEADRPVITRSHSLFKLLRQPVAPRRRLALIHNAGPIRTPWEINECDFRDVCWTSSRYNDRGRSTSAAGSRTDKRRICIIPLFLRFHRKMNKRTASTRGSFRSILSIRLIKLAHLHNVAACLRVVAPRRNYFRRRQTFVLFSRMHNLPGDFPKRKLGANVRPMWYLSLIYPGTFRTVTATFG